MKINNQRLNQWLSGEIAAYNDGTPESIAMIKELCRRSWCISTLTGSDKFYAYDKKTGWYSYDGPKEGLASYHVSWFFEAEDVSEIESVYDKLIQTFRDKKEALENANPGMEVSIRLTECEGYNGYEFRFTLIPKKHKTT